MSLFGSLFAGVSALGAQSQSMGMISDNIANVNTVGYKRKEADFESLVTTQSRSTAFSPGAVRANTLRRIDQQGVIQQSRSATDLAISGNGFFVVRQTAQGGSLEETFYTRSGAFSEDNQGVLRNTQGNVLMGWPLDQSGNIPANNADLSSLVPVDVAFLSGITRATTSVDFGLNLSAAETPTTWPSAGAPSAGPLSGSGGSSDFTRSVTVFDSLGQAQQLTLNFTHHTSPTSTIEGDVDLSSIDNIFDDLAGSISTTANVDTGVDISGGATSVAGGPDDGDSFIIEANGQTATIVLNAAADADTDIISDINSQIAGLASSNGSGGIDLDSTNTPIIIRSGGSQPATQSELNAIGFTVDTYPRADRTFTLDDNNTGGAQTVTISEGDSAADLVANINALTGINAQFNGDGEIVITNDATGFDLDITSADLTDPELAALGLPAAGTTATSPTQPTLLTPLAQTANPLNWWDVEIQDTNGLTLSRGSINFLGDGSVNSSQSNPSINLSGITFPGGASPQTIAINLENISQFSNEYNVAFVEQDGAALGLRSGVSVTNDGVVEVSFTNGETAEIYQLPLATFANTNGLNELNGNLFQQTSESGQFNLRQANNGGAGGIEGGSLEASNVDLADEFAKMIITQRAYTAATRSINTADSMLEDLIRLR